MARRVKFIWGASRVIRGRWYLGLFGLYDRAEGQREDGLAVSLRGVLVWGGFFAIALWVAAALALFWIWQRNSYNSLTYADAFFYPIRRGQIAEKKGQAFIAEGQDLFRAKKWHEAANLLRLGLARYPRDFRARLSLAQYYLLLNRRPLALRTLQEGAADAVYPGRAYLDFWFNAAEQGEDYESVAQTSAVYLPRLQREGPVTDYRWLNERRFAALLAAGRAAEALALAESEGAGETADEHRVMALLASGRPEDAVNFLQAWRARPGADVERIVRLQVRALREAKRFEEMDRALAELRTLRSADPAPLVYAVVQQAMAGREAAATAAFEEFLFRFGGTRENLLLVANPLAEINHLPLLQRCHAAAAERGYAVQRFQELMVQTQLRRGEWEDARRGLASFPPETGREAAAAQIWRTWMESLVEAATLPADRAQTSIVEFLRGRPWPIRVFRQSVETLMRAERWETARDVNAVALGAFPESKWLKTQGDEITLQLAAHAVALPAEKMAGAARDVGEKMFVQRLENLLHAALWNQAARHIQQVEAIRPAPAWLPGRDATIRLAQVRIAQAERDLPGMLSAARLFLNGDDVRSRQLLELARADFAAGNREFAVALAREIANRSSNFAVVKVALAEWEPQAPEANELANKKAAKDPRVIQVGSAGGMAEDAAELLGHVRARQKSGESQAMLVAARIFLSGDRARSQQMLEMAREFVALGDRTAAATLVREVLRRTPGFPPARRLATEWGLGETK